MVQLDRMTQPSVTDFEAASKVCYTRFPYQQKLDTRERFLGFQKLGVELAVIRGSDGALQSVAFLLPSQLTLGTETLRWNYMFQVAGLPTAAGAGGLLIRQVMQAAQREQSKRPFEVNVCGEMSGEPLYVPLLVGLGLRQLSATPRKIPEIKQVIRHLKVSEAQRIAETALSMDSARLVSSYLRDQLRRMDDSPL